MPITKQTLEFLMENRLRNSREWFHDHKAEYRKYVVEPMTALAEELAPVMIGIDPELITEPKVGKVLSRVNRDTRFTKDKSFYREVMWLGYTRDKKRYPCRPGFFFEFSPEGFRYGCGCYSLPPAVMEKTRQMILNGDPLFKAAKRAVDSQDVFHLEGEFYKRTRCPGQPEELRDWVERKNLDLIHNSQDFELLFSDRLGKVLSENYIKIGAFHAFMLAGTALADVI